MSDLVSFPKMSISGDIGSGKSVVGALLREETGCPLYSTGSIQREIAERYGMTTLELNQYSENHPEIDEEIDGTSIALGEKDESFLIDSRIAWHFIPHSFKVYLAVAPTIAAERILGDRGRTGESYDDLATARDKIRKRRASEVERFQKTYGIDLSDLGNYDLVVETCCSPPEEIAAVILRSFREWAEGRPVPGAYLPPQLLVSAQGGHDVVREVLGEEASDGRVRTVRSGDRYVLISGHERVAAAVDDGTGLLAAELVTDVDVEGLAGE